MLTLNSKPSSIATPYTALREVTVVESWSSSSWSKTPTALKLGRKEEAVEKLTCPDIWISSWGGRGPSLSLFFSSSLLPFLCVFYCQWSQKGPMIRSLLPFLPSFMFFYHQRRDLALQLRSILVKMPEGRKTRAQVREKGAKFRSYQRELQSKKSDEIAKGNKTNGRICLAGDGLSPSPPSPPPFSFSFLIWTNSFSC